MAEIANLEIFKKVDIQYDSVNPEKESIMQIEFSKQEFRILLDILEIADWILNAHHSHTPDSCKKYSYFEQKIFSQAEAFGFNDLIEYVEKHQEYFPTKKHDDNSNVMPIIKEFEKDSFWEDIVEELAKRDMLRKYGEKKLSSMKSKEIFMAMQEFGEKYANEFNQALNNMDQSFSQAHNQELQSRQQNTQALLNSLQQQQMINAQNTQNMQNNQNMQRLINNQNRPTSTNCRFVGNTMYCEVCQVELCFDIVG